MSRLYFINCVCDLYMARSVVNCQGFIRLTAREIRNEEVLKDKVQEAFEVGKVVKQESISDAIKRAQKNIPNPPPTIVRYEQMKLVLNALTDITGGVSGLFAVQFTGVSLERRQETHNVVMHIDFGAIKNLQQLQQLVLNTHNRRHSSKFNEGSNVSIVCLSLISD